MRTHRKVKPCYDDKRHRWYSRERWGAEPLKQLWCERCGAWERDVRI